MRAIGVLLATTSCNAVLGIQYFEAGPPDDGAADVRLDAVWREAGVDGALDANGIDSSACTKGGARCSGNGVETCDAMGQWGAAVACSAPTPNCYAGSCTATPLSCAPGGPGISQCGTRTDSCCTTVKVLGGTYSRTYTNTGKGATGTADPATVSHFSLDEYLVTVGRFRQFVEAWASGAGYFPSSGSGKHAHLNSGNGLTNSASSGTYEPGWKSSDDARVDPTTKGLLCDPSYATWTTSAGDNENLPINCVTWYEAYAFCIWDGGFLPSEAEWEFAGAGGMEQREYPWGEIAPGSGATYAIYGCLYPSGAGGVCHDVKNIAPVGSAPMGAALTGALDLAGEVSEWTLDWEATYVDPCVDCAYLNATSGRVVRGSSFVSNATALPPWTRALVDPAGRNRGVGFRCAQSP